ncbi:MAG: 4-(cytidine 5'-diphospho)-2-C-methyl-D-erythritol kinase [Oscillospiraceae bacterium]|jgi:4-diphosphocytidyl-2-C-methyl-D-erythritol kinase|nr:4-(cytidine 5'-diphospho)-2-C-methyl-D-erythritol kinase [Oscillospiraceae bacterium]
MIHANAKINLSLDVVGTLPNGYHLVESVMTAVAFGDTIELCETDGTGVKFSSDAPYLPSDKRNNCVKAARLYYNSAGLERALTVNCRKRIPVGGGLGGSSADAAAVLLALNRTHGIFTQKGLMQIGARIGADVPFLIAGGTALATGIGEKLEPISPFRDEGIVIIRPEFSSSTPELFAAIERNPPKMRPDTAALVMALSSGNLKTIGKLIYNVFEDALAPRERRMVYDAKSKLLEHGAVGASMSGTGSAVFGLFDDLSVAKQAFLKLRESGTECFLTRAKNYAES